MRTVDCGIVVVTVEGGIVIYVVMRLREAEVEVDGKGAPPGPLDTRIAAHTVGLVE